MFQINKLFVLAFPLALFQKPIFGTIYLFLIGIYGVIQFLKENEHKRKLINIITVIFYTYVSLMLIVSINGNNFEYFTDEYSAYLYILAPFIGITLQKFNYKKEDLINVLKLCLSLIGIGVLLKYDHEYAVNHTGYRVLWSSQLGAAMIPIILLNTHNENIKEKLITITVASLGINAIIMCGTRGPIILLLILLIIGLVLHIFAINKNRRKSTSYVYIIIFIITAGLISQSALIAKRIEVTKITLFTFHKSEDANEYLTTRSLSQRFIMWDSAIEAINDKKYTGHGFSKAADVIHKYGNEDYKNFLMSVGHVHNSYLQHGLYGGIPAIIILIVIKTCLLWIFTNNYLKGDSKIESSMGIIVVFFAVIFGMSDLAIGGIFENLFFIYFIYFILSLKKIRIDNRRYNKIAY